MKKKKMIYIVFSSVIACSILFGLTNIKLEAYDSDNNNTQKIIMNEYQKYEDGSVYNGTRTYLFDQKSNTIYDRRENSIGTVEFYYKINGEKVDMYSRNGGSGSFLIDKNIDRSNSQVDSILELFDIKNYEDIEPVKNEIKKQNKVVLKENNTDKSILSVGKDDRKNIVTELNSSEKNRENFFKESRDMDILINKNNLRVEKVTVDCTEGALLDYYSDSSGKKLPLETTVNMDYYYDISSKVLLPKNGIILNK